MQSAHLRLNTALGLAGSPRRQGNSDTAAQEFSAGFLAGGGRMDLIYLRDRRLLPCTSCGACERFAPAHASREGQPGLALLAGQSPRICPLAAQDDSAEIFSRLYSTQALVIASPIFFYHLPALLKGFIDRGQAFHMLREQHDQTIRNLPRRPAWTVLVSGRSTGERLFEGSLLTLRYFCELFNFDLMDPFLLPGFDGPSDLASTPVALEPIRQYGARAAQTLAAWGTRA